MAYFLLLVPAYLLTKFLGFIDFNLAIRLLVTLPMILLILKPFFFISSSDSPVSRWRSIWKP